MVKIPFGLSDEGLQRLLYGLTKQYPRPTSVLREYVTNGVDEAIEVPNGQVTVLLDPQNIVRDLNN